MRSLAVPMGHRRALFTCLVLVALGGLTACGTAQEPGQQVPSCGALTVSFNPYDQYAANYDGHRVKEIEQCFVHAYHQCKAMSLLVTVHGVDTGTHYTYTITPHGSSCQISASAQNYSANFGGSQGPVTTSTCGGLLIETADTLVIGTCQGQEGTIPRGEACGSVYQQAPPAQVKFAEDCFAEDDQQCYPASLDYEPSTEAFDELQINASCQLALVQQGNLPGTPCASLTQQADGLHVMGCGILGDLLVPAHPA